MENTNIGGESLILEANSLNLSMLSTMTSNQEHDTVARTLFGAFFTVGKPAGSSDLTHAFACDLGDSQTIDPRHSLSPC